MVEAGDGILVIEAMKMEHRLAAQLAGVVHLAARVGDRVAADQELAVIEAAEPAPAPAPAGPEEEDSTAPTRDGEGAALRRLRFPTTEGRP